MIAAYFYGSGGWTGDIEGLGQVYFMFLQRWQATLKPSVLLRIQIEGIQAR